MVHPLGCVRVSSCWACRAGPAQHQPGAHPLSWAGTGLGKGRARVGGEAPECAPSSCCSPSLNRCTTFVSLCLSCPLPLQLHQGGSSAFLSLCLSPGHPAESLPPPEGDLAAGSICPTLPSTAWELLPGHSPFINL